MYLVKFDNSDYYSTQEFHNDREGVDHSLEPGHVDRMNAVINLTNMLLDAHGGGKVIDYGAGAGAIIEKVRSVDKVGYDFCPDNIRIANESNRPVVFKNFLEDELEPCFIAIASEVLEHMALPHEFLKNLKSEYLVCSFPNGETQESHWYGHSWGMDNEGAKELLFKPTGWNPIMQVNIWGTQCFVCQRR